MFTSLLAWRGLLVVAGLSLASEGLYYLLRYLKRRRERRPQVLFFPVPVTCVRPLLLARPGRCDCGLSHQESALSSLARLLLSARRSLDVCVFTISSLELSGSVLAVHGRGVRVRVVTDSDYMALAGSQVGTFRKAGSRQNQSSRICNQTDAWQRAGDNAGHTAKSRLAATPGREHWTIRNESGKEKTSINH
ncbi:mitochondrial cardiolipin hydrolase isoform X2 [Heptranchias perlo]|uniref:mitochondrial cardiolipin hydrolase isoform X2 n=1 Tax=Heptranchias perlo TaxID=212740 RepID=UPI003559FA13